MKIFFKKKKGEIDMSSVEVFDDEERAFEDFTI